MIIKPLVVACLAALLHVNFAAVPAAKTETEEVKPILPLQRPKRMQLGMR